MKLDRPFIRLPLTFDAAKLAAEVATFDESAWRPHPQGFAGNSALPLIAANGDPDDDDVRGPMRPTHHFDRLPYLKQVLAAFHAVWGRTRLMRIDGNAEATAHADTNYYWARHARVHVPIVTTPNVAFLCGDAQVHMAAGEAWIFDTWRHHNVLNPEPTRRIHLVADTIGSAAFWQLVDRGVEGAPARFVPYDPLRAVPIATESFNHPVVMSPAELDAMIALIDAPVLQPALSALARDWRAAWARFGEQRDGFVLYRQLLARAAAEIEPLAGKSILPNRVDAVDAAKSLIFRVALDDQPATVARTRARRLERPVFIVSPPRSGSTLFFETLSQSPDLFTILGESHRVIEGMPALHPSAHRFHSNRLTAADAQPAIVAELEERFVRNLHDRDGKRPARGAAPLRMLEKTPKNSLRVPFLAAAFPDARFIYLYRDMRDTISSMLDAWRSGKFVTYPELPGWNGPAWSLLLTPGWRELAGKPLAEIVAAQWSTATRYLLDDLEQLPPDRWCIASYDALLANPQQEMERLAAFLEVRWDRQLASPLPLSRTTLTPPDPEKWKRNKPDLDVALPLVNEVAERARSLFAAAPSREPRPAPPAATSAPAEQSFRSVYTAAFAQALAATGGSLLVTTYQSGRLITLRPKDGTVNTHFRAFASPMGIALRGEHLTLGTKNFLWYFRNHRPLAQSLGTGAAYLPMSARATADIRIHELVYTNDTLIGVNTRFSCLSRFDGPHHFEPVWRPHFITDLAAEDRCHLNGVAVIDGRVRYVTALGDTNTQQGWRERKADGGIVMDVDANEIVARGLSMPHSPRWYDEKLYVLESGEGRLVTIDPRDGRKDVVADVPGFARGIAFAGGVAFIGLSQVRESVFNGIPIATRVDRTCGVWAVDLRTGNTIGFLRFEGIVQEIFDIQLLSGVPMPDIFEPSDDIVGTAFHLATMETPTK